MDQAADGAEAAEAPALSERVILESQIRGERSIAIARCILIAILAAFAVYVFTTSVAERGIYTEIRRAVYYVEVFCLLLAGAITILILRITSRGEYRPWMRYLPAIVDVSSVAAVHWAMAVSNNPSYSFTGAVVWFYILFVALSSMRNSAASVLFTGAYAAAAFIALNTAFFAAMGNFAEGGNVYANAAGRALKLDFEDEVIKAVVILAATGILAVISRRNTLMVRKQIELHETADRYARTLKEINESLERFIPREFLGFLGKENILEVELGNWSEREMTIFFLDIRNFTALSENMSPRDNFRFLNSFLSIFGPIVRTHGGFIDKYPGDGIMALFPEGPDGALASALEMRERLVDYNAGRAKGGYDPIRFGIGIHAGPLMLGTIGENNRMDSTVISDSVNTASRLEGLTKKFSKDILISGQILGALARPEDYVTRYLGEERVKGRAMAVEVFELVGRAAGASSPA
jgi:class 3 adenylate cyclase